MRKFAYGRPCYLLIQISWVGFTLNLMLNVFQHVINHFDNVRIIKNIENLGTLPPATNQLVTVEDSQLL